MIDVVLFGFTAYALGSIPTSVWLGRATYGVDIRKHGSKNAGATNTFRILGKKPGIIVLFIDIAKGLLAVLLPLLTGWVEWGTEVLIHTQIVCAISAVLGHVFPLFAGFRGGKGVATSLGVITGIHPPAAGICLGIFLVVLSISRFVSLGAIVAAISFPLVLWLVFKVESPWLKGFSTILSIAVIIAHKKNIRRLIRGEENRMNLFHK